jgi:hypothetical protein
VRRSGGEKTEDSPLCNLFAPVQASAADQAQRVRILAGQLPDKTKARCAQTVEIVRIGTREQVAAPLVGENLAPELVVSLTK